MAYVVQVSESAVRDALRAIRYHRSLAGNPLLHLERVDEWLRRGGVSRDDRSREAELARLLEEVVLSHLRQLRGARASISATEDAMLDFRSGRIEIECWSALYHRYLANHGMTVAAFASHVGVTVKSFDRRLASGHRLLRDALIAIEESLTVGPEPDPHRPANGTTMSDGEEDRLTRYRLDRVMQWSDSDVETGGGFLPRVLTIESRSPLTREPEHFESLRALLEGARDRAFVLLGEPGSGKSTVLRNLEYQLARDGLQTTSIALPLLLPLGSVPPGVALGESTSLTDWVANEWRRRGADLPPLDDLLAQGKLVLLLDGLNELPARDEGDWRRQVRAWKALLHSVLSAHSGNRVVVSSRSLDYSLPLSTPESPVREVFLEPLSNELIRIYMGARLGETWGEHLWSEVRGAPHLSLARLPFFLDLIVRAAADAASLPNGPAAALTAFVRHALIRELERDNPKLEPGRLLSRRDYMRVARARSWRTPWELPDESPIIAGLTELAYRMQAAPSGGGGRSASVEYQTALDLIGQEHAADVLDVGGALGILDDDRDRDALAFHHQLIQEYFAARRLAAAFDPFLVARPWKADEITPSITGVLAALAPHDTLPPMPSSGWEEPIRMAVAISGSPESLLTELHAVNLSLATEVAARPEVRSRLSSEFIVGLQRALVTRLDEPLADLRDRLACGTALGRIGDSRFDLQAGVDAPCLLPPLNTVPGATYPIGADEPIVWTAGTDSNHIPLHRVTVETFRIGRFPVTNSEWALFMDAGGYEEPQWWTNAAAREWLSGIGTDDGRRRGLMWWLRRLQTAPELLESEFRLGKCTEDVYVRWRRRLQMSAAEVQEELTRTYPDGPIRKPRYWDDPNFNGPNQPVVGISWFEAQAYCHWLSVQTGTSFRLPTEAEWECACRGAEGRRFAWGNTYEPLFANVPELRLHRTSPVGIFPEGNTPTGIADMTGQVWEWTSTAWGTDAGTPAFTYPYDSTDGREDEHLDSSWCRVVKGSSHVALRGGGRAEFRGGNWPSDTGFDRGFRIATGGN